MPEIMQADARQLSTLEDGLEVRAARFVAFIMVPL
jgi:hypothetical protein